MLVRVPPELVEPAGHLFQRYGHGLAVESVPEEPLVTLRTYLSPRARQALARIEVGLRLMALVQPVDGPHVQTLAQDDWANAWKQHFTVLHVGRRTVIKPSWLSHEVTEGQIVIELDPGMAFGTGHHPSTRLCLEALEGLVRPGARVVDVGTGSGVLAVAALKLGAGAVVGLDVDADAVRTARENLRRNGVHRAARVARGTLPHALVPPGGFNLALANISARVVGELAPHLAAALCPGGVLVASGIIEAQRPVAEGPLLACGLHLGEVLREQDWVALVLRKG